MERGRKKGYSDPNAWVNSPQADEVAAFYAEGHSVKETAERFGITKNQVNNLAVKRQISNGRARAGALKEDIDSRKAEAEKRIAKILPEFGLEYLGGYTGRRNKVRVKCLRCGAEYERTIQFIYAGTVPVCVECQKLETLKRHEELRKEQRKKAKEQADVRRLEREWYRRFHPKVKTAKKKPNKNHRKRAREYGGEYDPSVTLKRLIERDGLRCAICGEMCDPNDHGWTKWFGPLHPTLDHVIPLSKGGSHTWDNVQVAHAICNSMKRDLIKDIAGDQTEEKNRV